MSNNVQTAGAALALQIEQAPQQLREKIDRAYTWDCIPDFRKQLPNWVLWRWEVAKNGKPTKRPYAAAGFPATITKREHCTTFEQVVATANAWGWNDPNVGGIGFVLFAEDGLVAVDWDNKIYAPANEDDKAQADQVIEHLQTCRDTTVSTRGWHAWIKANLLNGFRHGRFEFYGCARFMVETGWQIEGTPTKPVEAQKFIDEFQAFHNRKLDSAGAWEDSEEEYSDAEICERASNASDGEKYVQLCGPDWDKMGYLSGSEAEFAALAMLCFWSKNDAQVERLFRMTALGKRPQAYDGRVKKAIARIRGKQAPQIDLTAFNARPLVSNVIALPVRQMDIQIVSEEELRIWAKPVAQPRGLLKEIFDYAMASMVQRVEIYALPAAITTFSGLVGRAFNSSRMGLSDYHNILGNPSTGKEGMATTTTRIYRGLAEIGLASALSRLAGTPVSGQALHKILTQSPCCVSHFAEFGYMIERLTNPKRNGADSALMKALLDTATKSGYGQFVPGAVYAQDARDMEGIDAPAYTLLCDAAPETVYRFLTGKILATGFMQRFIHQEYVYQGDAYNRDHGFMPPEELLHRIKAFAFAAFTIESDKRVVNIELHPSIIEKDEVFRVECLAKAHSGGDEESPMLLWGRAREHVLRLAGLSALGMADFEVPANDRASEKFELPPVAITEADYDFAVNYCTRGIHLMVERFRDGTAGGDFVLKANECLKKAMGQYRDLSYDQRAKSKDIPECLHYHPEIIPASWLIWRLQQWAPFRGDDRKHRAIAEFLRDYAVPSGKLVPIDMVTVKAMTKASNQKLPFYEFGFNWDA